MQSTVTCTDAAGAAAAAHGSSIAAAAAEATHAQTNKRDTCIACGHPRVQAAAWMAARAEQNAATVFCGCRDPQQPQTPSP